MSRRVLPAVAAAACLSLAACGGGSSATASPGTGSSASTAASSSAASNALAQLCTTYCASLQKQASVCPLGTTNLIACSQPLAAGADQVDALTKALNAPGSGETPQLIQAITKAQDAYDTWTNSSGCDLIADTQDPDFARIFPGGKTGIVTCSAEAATVSLTQADVGLVLRNASQGR